jgi:hypothetical protein
MGVLMRGIGMIKIIKWCKECLSLGDYATILFLIAMAYIWIVYFD